MHVPLHVGVPPTYVGVHVVQLAKLQPSHCSPPSTMLLPHVADCVVVVLVLDGGVVVVVAVSASGAQSSFAATGVTVLLPN